MTTNTQVKADVLLPALTRLETNDALKEEVQNQWDNDACGSHYVENAEEGTLDWYLEAEAYRYNVYAPWMHKVMEFENFQDKRVLEIGAGMGTDLAQFAKHGAKTTDLDLSSGHLQHAKTNFSLRGLPGEFQHGDGENIPFEDNTFDLVYSNGVIHHTPNTASVVAEMHRVLKPGGRIIIMVYAENSWHYWYQLVTRIGIQQQELSTRSMGWVMSGTVEISEHGQRPLVKVYTKPRMREMFRSAGFRGIRISQNQMVEGELPQRLSWIPISIARRLAGWNLILKAQK